MLHPDIMTISYQHRHRLKKAFRDVVGFKDKIIHFALDLVRPDGQMVVLSSTPSHVYEVCAQGYGAYDATISPENYQNREFYWWNDVKHRCHSQEINYIKRVRHGFRSGFMMVRKWDDFHLIYSFAANSDSRDFVEQVEGERDQYLELGDYVYNATRDLYSEYTGDFVPPRVNRFHAYKGGRPEHYLSQYQKTEQGVLVPRPVAEISKSSHLKLVVDNKSRKSSFAL